MPVPLLGHPVVAARTVERCESCRTERALGTGAPCRCAAPRWQRFCTKCVRAIDADVCPHCLAVATENGRQVRLALEKSLSARGGLAGALDHHARLRARVAGTMREFALAELVPAIPEWATRLVDKRVPLPPGAEHSRPKMAAIADLRLEDAAVRVARDALGYMGLPAETKLEAALRAGDDAAELLGGWDGVLGHASQEALLRQASESLLASDALAGTVLETIKTRDVSRLVDAARRRTRALAACERALGLA